MGARVAVAGLLLTLTLNCSNGDERGTSSARSAQTTTQRARARTARAARPVPWIELITVNDQTVSEAIEGLRYWSQVTDTAIVTLVPGKSALYFRIRQEVPGVQIIPALPTAAVLMTDKLDSVAGWRTIAREVRQICRRTGCDTYLLENEVAVKAYLEGKREIDFDRFRAGLEQLPKDLKVLWYPCIGSNDWEPRYLRLAEVVDDVLNARLVDHLSMYNRHHLNHPRVKATMGRLDKVISRPPVQMIYCMKSPGYWALEDVPEALRLAHGDWAIVYPGAKAWVEAARVISQRLLELNQVPGRP